TDGTRHRTSFSTGTTVQIGRAPVAVLRAGRDRALRWSLKGKVRARTARVVWRSPARTFRYTARIVKKVARVPAPTARGTYTVTLRVQGRTLTLGGPVLIR